MIYLEISENELVNKRGPTTVTINYGNFNTELEIGLHGLINFNHCSFNNQNTVIIINRSRDEPAILTDNVRSEHSFVFNRSINMYTTKFGPYSILDIYIEETDYQILFIHCDLKGIILIKSFGNNDVTSVSSIQIEYGSMTKLPVDIVSSPGYLTHFTVIGVSMLDVRLTNRDDYENNNLLVHVENSTWVNHDEGFMELFNVICASIISSLMVGSCSSCTLIDVYGQSDLRDPIFRPYLKPVTYIIDYPIASLSFVETIFEAPERLQDKINSKKISITLINSTFNIEGRVSFNAESIFEAENFLIQCSVGNMAQRSYSDQRAIFTCNSVCEGESMYFLQAGQLMINQYPTPFLQQSDPHLNYFVPSCHSCPIGAKCENGIQALPNYWGYGIHNDSISLIRCPDGYCCQGNETCKEIDSCNTGRTGTLCAICKSNLAESMFTPECIPTEICKSGLVTTLLISTALVYAVVLLIFSTIRNKFTYVLKKGHSTCKEKCQKDNGKVNNISMESSVQDNQPGESGMKYMQIHFYYVQDSKLFNIYLPKVDVKTENIIVKFLTFSPFILETYVDARELCFVFSSAIIKVVLELSFRLLVILFLFLIILIQRCLLHCIKRKVFLEKLKVKLVEGFLLLVLVSYQKLLIRTFALVQCVNIQDYTVLFIQADVECYTWWQIGILIYICVCVVPLFFVLAHLPFDVKDMKMSVKTFVLACIFPLNHLRRISKILENFLGRGGGSFA